MQQTNFSTQGVKKQSLMLLSFIFVSLVSTTAFSSDGGGFNSFLDKALNAAEKYADKKSTPPTQNPNDKSSNQFAQGQNNQYYQGGQYSQGQGYPYSQGQNNQYYPNQYSQGQGYPYSNQLPQGQYPQGSGVQGQGSPYQTQYPSQYPQDPNNPFSGQYSSSYYSQYSQGQNAPYPGLLPPGYSQPPQGQNAPYPGLLPPGYSQPPQMDPYTGQLLPPGYGPYPYPPQCQCAPAATNQFVNKQAPQDPRLNDRRIQNRVPSDQNPYQNGRGDYYNRNAAPLDQTDRFGNNRWNNNNFEDDIYDLDE